MSENERDHQDVIGGGKRKRDWTGAARELLRTVDPVGVGTSVVEAEPIEIRCPLCGRDGVTASVREETEEVQLLEAIPLFGVHHAFLKCNACGGRLESKVPVAQLCGCTPEQLRTVVVPRVGIGGLLVLLIGLLLCWVPLIGLLLTGLAVLWNRRYRRWTYPASWTVFLLSVAVHTAIVVLAMLGQL